MLTVRVHMQMRCDVKTHPGFFSQLDCSEENSREMYIVAAGEALKNKPDIVFLVCVLD